VIDVRLNSIDVPQAVVEAIFRAEMQVGFQPGAAKPVIEKVIQEYPNYDVPHRLLAQMHLRNGDIVACLKELETTLAISPKNTQALGLMARAQAAEFNYAPATETINKALTLAPESEELRLLRRAIEFLAGIEDDICPIEEQVAVLCKRLQHLGSFAKRSDA
jgi:tetratricopeptide (TPR) repeat protein